MNQFVNLKGRRFGRLKVITRAHNNKYGQAMWFCICKCGIKIKTLAASLLRGATKSCGCLHRELAKTQRLTHGLTQTSIYSRWAEMLQRCQNPQHKSYNNYGGRGIKVCKRWLYKDGFSNFLSDMGMPPKNKTLDRKNNEGDYKPSNCRWATRKEQRHNQRSIPVLQARIKFLERKLAHVYSTA